MHSAFLPFCPSLKTFCRQPCQKAAAAAAPLLYFAAQVESSCCTATCRAGRAAAARRLGRRACSRRRARAPRAPRSCAGCGAVACVWDLCVCVWVLASVGFFCVWLGLRERGEPPDKSKGRPSPAQRAAHSTQHTQSSRSRTMILPLRVFGSPGAQWITSGAANAPMIARTLPTSSLRSSSLGSTRSMSVTYA